MEVTSPVSMLPAICPSPVFVIGSPRSGTTILAWALARHSGLWTSGESYILFDLFGRRRADTVYDQAKELSEGSWLQTQGVSRKEFLESLGLGINALFSSRSGGKRWIDHTPHYALMADVLADMFPGARFLHILRDGREVVRSMQSFLNVVKNDPKRASVVESGAIAPWATNFPEACKTWREYSDAAMQFTVKNPGRCLTVRHEELQLDPGETLGRVLEFLGLAHEDGPAEYARSNRLNSSFPVGPNGAGSADRSSTAWEEWTAEQRRVFADVAGSALVRYGFATDEEMALSEYDQMALQITRLAAARLPVGAKVVVASMGDPQLLELADRQPGHFPQDETGEYMGNPGDSEEAVSQLEAVRGRGTEFLILPSTVFWWLEYYAGFRRHLDDSTRCIWKNEDCIIYRLSPAIPTGESEMSSHVRSLTTKSRCKFTRPFSGC